MLGQTLTKLLKVLPWHKIAQEHSVVLAQRDQIKTDQATFHVAMAPSLLLTGCTQHFRRQCACRVSKTKLVAYNGKLIRVEEAQGGESPNGSGFVITTQAAPQLDATNLVVGHVVDGMDIVEQLTKLPTVKSNSNSVFFR